MIKALIITVSLVAATQKLVPWDKSRCRHPMLRLGPYGCQCAAEGAERIKNYGLQYSQNPCECYNSEFKMAGPNYSHCGLTQKEKDKRFSDRQKAANLDMAWMRRGRSSYGGYGGYGGYSGNYALSNRANQYVNEMASIINVPTISP